MIVQCPKCNSEDVTNLSYDSNDFICNDCGEDFQADNGITLEEEDDDIENGNSGFIDMDSATALNIAKGLKNENLNNEQNQNP